MYARLVRFSLGTGRRGVAQAIADDLAPQITWQPGCGGVTVFGDHSDGEYWHQGSGSGRTLGAEHEIHGLAMQPASDRGGLVLAGKHQVLGTVAAR